MSCVRAAPTAAPAMRPAMRNTVMAVGNTSVGENMLAKDRGTYEQQGQGPTHASLSLLPLSSSSPSFPLALETGLRARASTMPNRFSTTDLASPAYMSCFLNSTNTSAPPPPLH